MRAVVVVVHRVAGERDGIEAVRAGRAGDRHAADSDRKRGRCGPKVADEVRVGIVDTGVNHGNDMRGRSNRDVPRLRGMNVCARLPGRPAVDRLTDVQQSPQLRGKRVWRIRKGMDDVVRLGVDDRRMRGENTEQGPRVLRPRAQPPQAGAPHRAHGVGVGDAGDVQEIACRHWPAQLHEHFAGRGLSTVNLLHTQTRVCARLRGWVRGRQDHGRHDRRCECEAPHVPSRDRHGRGAFAGGSLQNCGPTCQNSSGFWRTGPNCGEAPGMVRIECQRGRLGILPLTSLEELER